MPWPDIFFRAKKSRPEQQPPPFHPAPEEEAAVPQTENSTPEPVAAVESSAPDPDLAPTQPLPRVGGIDPEQTPAVAKEVLLPPGETGRSPLQGVVLRPPPQMNSTGIPVSAESARSTARMKNIEQLMAEADPVHTLRQTGSIRLLKRLPPEPTPPQAPVETQVMPEIPEPERPRPLAPMVVSTPSDTVPLPRPILAASSQPRPLPTVEPEMAKPVELKKTESLPVPASQDNPNVTVKSSPEDDSPFILKPSAAPVTPPASASTPMAKLIPTSTPPLTQIGSVFRRKAKMTELARIVLPPKREEHDPAPVRSGPSPTVVPPAFPVAAMTARAAHHTAERQPTEKVISPAAENNPPEKIVVVEKAVEPVAEKPSVEPQDHEAKTPPDHISSPEKITSQEPTIVLPEASKSEALTDTPAPVPKAVPETPQDSPVSPLIPPPGPSTLAVPPEKREFHLANGERVAGIVLSETPDAVYISHGTLGVLTVPRSQIAKRLVEIILINGDRIVGDIMAETADTLYVRHASLGMLTVPRAQRSTRVVEAILKDGDRILGEVLTESETFTVIRSATLGTVTVQHSNVAMLNRKIEQIELKALPPVPPEIKDREKT